MRISLDPPPYKTFQDMSNSSYVKFFVRLPSSIQSTGLKKSWRPRWWLQSIVFFFLLQSYLLFWMHVHFWVVTFWRLRGHQDILLFSRIHERTPEPQNSPKTSMIDHHVLQRCLFSSLPLSPNMQMVFMGKKLDFGWPQHKIFYMDDDWWSSGPSSIHNSQKKINIYIYIQMGKMREVNT